LARPLAWGDTEIDDLFTSAATKSPVDLLTTLTPSDTITAIRIIIRLYCIPQNLSDNIDGGSRIDIGIGVAAEEAFTANVVPDPSVMADVPARGWLWKGTLIAVANTVTGPPARDIYYGTEISADVRAMRKVDRGNLYIARQAKDFSVSGSFLPVTLVGMVRVLCAT